MSYHLASFMPMVGFLHARMAFLLCSCSGYRLAESAAQNRAIGGDPLDVNVMKFICKEFWIEIFKKQVSLPAQLS